MTTHDTTSEHLEDHHPSAMRYVQIAIILFIITAVEVAIVYQSFSRAMILISLGVLAVAKFLLVVGFFMHLKFDHVLFRWMFAGGLVLAIAVLTAFLALFRL